MDNSGRRPLLVPGFGGMSIYHELGVDERFADAKTGWEQKPAITAPEMAMLQLMSDLTDKSDWNVDVFDNAIVAKWHEETFKAQKAKAKGEDLEMRVISERAWDWCILELRDKALTFGKDQFVRVFDAGSAVCKSDVLVSESTRLKLKDSIAPLLKQPISYKSQQALVDPCLFPLAYGKTSVLMEGQVCLQDTVESFGSGKLSPRQLDERLNTSDVDSRIKAGRGLIFESDEIDDLRPFLWSSDFQLLPCEVEFHESDTGINARITSYINNLHPIHHHSVYYIVEQLISLAIKPWNECLVKGEKPRWPIRIRTYGLTWEPQFPMALVNRLRQDPTTEIYKEAMKEVEEFLKLPNRDGSIQPPVIGSWHIYAYMHIRDKWEKLYTPNIPEPGISFSYNDWKDGRNGAAIEKKHNYKKPQSSLPIQSEPDHEFYSIRLEDTFRDQGLQVIVKIGSIALSHTSDWHMDTLNEHIVATAIYFYDVENTTEIKVSFRQNAYIIEEDYQYNRSNYGAFPDRFEVHREDIEAMLGFKEKSNLFVTLPTQELGYVCAPQGRLITWPSTLQYRFEPVTLVDATIPGHCRYVMLSLVDPYYRICSTRNVPPQEHAWWAEEVHKILASRRIPLEIAVIITEMTGGWPVSIDEARLRRERLLNERKWAEKAFRELMVWNYDGFGGEF